MKQNKKWQAILLSGLMLVTLVGCGERANNVNAPKQSVVPSDNVEGENSVDTDIYNSAYEKYTNVTELGVIVNDPVEDDLNALTVIEEYGDDKEESMLIIPKYNSSKITVSSAEYTGEQYIAKDVLFVNESTPAGYGLRLYAYRPEGIPQIIVTINYQNMSYKYVVSSNGKEGNTGVEYLCLETDTSSGAQGDMISAIQDDTYVKGLTLFNSTPVDIDKDGNDEYVEVYCDGELSASGEYLLDDRQTWALIVRDNELIYPLFDKSEIQLGKLQYAVYQDYDDYDNVHIIVEYKSNTDLYYYDCTFDDSTGYIIRNNYFEANNINLIEYWK